MNHFIKLSSRVINKLHIIEITKHPSKYYISMSNNYISGIMLFGWGNLSSSNNYIQICETNNKEDYDTITEFLKEIK